MFKYTRYRIVRIAFLRLDLREGSSRRSGVLELTAQLLVLADLLDPRAALSFERDRAVRTVHSIGRVIAHHAITFIIIESIAQKVLDPKVLLIRERSILQVQADDLLICGHGHVCIVEKTLPGVECENIRFLERFRGRTDIGIIILITQTITREIIDPAIIIDIVVRESEQSAIPISRGEDIE